MRIPFTTAGRRQGFTLPELMVAIAVFSVVMLGVVFAHLFGLSMFRITETTLNATEDTRQVINRMANEVRTCRRAFIGNISGGAFVGLLNGERQVGSAILIRPTTNTANYIVYFVNPADQTLRRTTGSPGSVVTLAESITNALAFSALDLSGRVLTNDQNNRVFHLNLEFYQPRRHRQVAEYYKLETSVTRRAMELP